MPTAHLFVEFDTTQYSLDEVLDRLRSRPNVAPADSKPSASETPTSPAAAAEQLAPRIVEFLSNDPRYRMRTLDAICRALGALSFDVVPALDNLIRDNKVKTRTRRSDGATLYMLA